jgi:AraC-like DNA-binding protein
MVCRVHIPRPPLSDFVELFWHYEGPGSPHAWERCFPTGMVKIFINLGDDGARAYDPRNASRPQSFRGPLVSGTHSGPFLIDTAGQELSMGAHFKPGGSLPFLGPAGELRDALVPLEALWGPGAARLRERLLDVVTPESRFGVFERVLLARLTGLSGGHPAVALALERFRNDHQLPKVSEVARWCGLSQRRLIRVFDEEIGLTPKLFSRVQRFQRALRLVEDGREMEWGSVALECGYFDQAHLINDFRGFSGVTPTAYLAGRGDYFNHLPLQE